jgi:hypothetical protein
MYSSYNSFRAEAIDCGTDYYVDESLQPNKTVAAFKIYENACAGTKLKDAEGQSIGFDVTIVGRLALRAEDNTWIPSDESFPSIDAILQENLKTLGEDSNDHGSILSARNWTLLANDAWLLGGIHTGTEFHFASPLEWKNLWATNEKRMTITAREAILIMACGYEIVRPHPKLEAIAVCKDFTAAQRASLLSLRDALLKYLDLDGLKVFYGQIPHEAKSYS